MFGKTSRIYGDHRFRRYGLNMMKLSDCKELDELQFIFNINIINIEYKNTEKIHINYLQKRRIMDCKSHCRWNILYETLYKTKENKNKQYLHGPIFNNNCFGLMLRVWSSSTKKNNRFRPSIKLYDLPQNIKKLQIEIIINIEPNIFYLQQIDKCLSYKPYLIETDLTLNDIIDKLNKYQCCVLSIYFYVKILNAWNIKNELIANENLSEYDFNCV